MADYNLVGKDYQTPDIVAKVKGQARYAEDFRAEGMVFIKLLGSPRPHARVRSIDASAALAMPGVHGILTAGRSAAATAAARRAGGRPRCGTAEARRRRPRHRRRRRTCCRLHRAATTPGRPRHRGRRRPRNSRQHRKVRRAAPDSRPRPAPRRREPPAPAPPRRRLVRRCRRSSRSRNEPLYEGEPILAVAADSEELAAEAIERIIVDLEPLDFVIDPLDSLRPGGPNGRTEGNVFVGAQRAKR